MDLKSHSKIDGKTIINWVRERSQQKQLKRFKQEISNRPSAKR